MKKFLLALGVTIAAGIVLQPIAAEACSCLPRTNEQHYCDSDFVVKAKVQRDLGDSHADGQRYRVKVKKSFKGDLQGTVIMSTSTSSATCGVELGIRKMYLLTGSITSDGTPRINLCNKVSTWRSLPRAERRQWKNGWSCTPELECPMGCDVWYDGCNNCTCDNGELGACTRRFCIQYTEPYCKEPCPQVRCMEPPRWCPTGYTVSMQYTENECPTCEVCEDGNGNILADNYCHTREVWSEEKTQWCCEHQGLGCPPCQATGCSGQVCADEPVITTCEWRPEYACLQHSSCERLPDGECGWQASRETQACLDNLE